MNTQPASAQTVVSHVRRGETETRLHGYWLVLVRLICLSLSVLSVGLFIASIPSYVAHLHLLCTGTAAACYTSGQLPPGDVQRLHELGLSRDFYATYTIVITSLAALGYWLVAAFLFWRKSDDRLALLAAVSLATFPIVFNTGLMNILPSPWWSLSYVLSFLGPLSIVLFFYVFPSGHFVPSFTRWVFVVTLLYWGFVYFFPVPSLNPLNPFSRSQVLGGGIVVVQTYRYQRVSSPAQRQQTKWVVYGVSLVSGGYLVLHTIALFFPSLFSTGSLGDLIYGTAFYGLLLLFPFSIGFAIVRSRLWDIDILINRTLVYGTLTTSLAFVYFGLIFALQSLLRGLINQNNDVAIVVSTLAIFILFHPLRKRIQAGIDRRFYRRKYDAAHTLAAFTATLRNEVDLSQISEDLVAVVQETMQPARISLWLRPLNQRGSSTRDCFHASRRKGDTHLDGNERAALCTAHQNFFKRLRCFHCTFPLAATGQMASSLPLR